MNQVISTAALGSKRVRDRSEFVPGILYALFERGEDSHGEPYDYQLAFAYWTGQEFLDEEGFEFEELWWEWAVPQGDTPNPDWIAVDDSNRHCEAGCAYAAGRHD